MGIIKAVTQAVGGAFADQWLEVIEADNMGDQTVFTKGTLIRRGENKKGTDNVVSNGSMIHVYDNQFIDAGGRRQDCRLHSRAGILQSGSFFHAVTAQRTTWRLHQGIV